MGLRPMAGDTDDPECLAGLRAPRGPVGTQTIPQTPERVRLDPRRLDLLMSIPQPHLQPLAVHHAQAGA